MAKRIIQTDLAGEDIVIEKGLRPESLDQYVGQSKAKNNLKIISYPCNLIRFHHV